MNIKLKGRNDDEEERPLLSLAVFVDSLRYFRSIRFHLFISNDVLLISSSIPMNVKMTVLYVCLSLLFLPASRVVNASSDHSFPIVVFYN